MDYHVTAKRIIKNVACPALDLCGIYDAMLARRVFAQSNWLILMYHRITANRDQDPFQLDMCTPRHVFSEQIEYHTRHFTPIAVGEAVARIHAGKPLPSHAVSVTFDDGYLDFKEIALPVLKRFQCPATVFITTGGLKERAAFWWDSAAEFIARTRKREVDIRALAPGAPIQTLSLGSRHRRRSLILLQNLLWEQPPDRIDEAVEHLRVQLEVDPCDEAPVPRMCHADIESIARDDIEVGAHCERHIDMRRLSAGECLHELETSRRVLRDLSGQPVSGFAYPGGRENSQVQKLVAHAGFTYAAGTVRGLNRTPYDMFSLQRIGMPNTGISDYKRCLAAAAGAAPSVIRYESVPWP